ncbi:tetratricopeptide repeat protein [Cystobacter ferrugineus]|nr:tetratricopeptide repeat protein [Cystobacter ferrugineus]
MQRLNKDPKDGEALLALAKVALLEGNDSRVTTLLQQATPHADKQELALVQGALMLKRQDWKKAREIYQPFATQEPIRYSGLFGLGVSLLELGQAKEARVVLERVVAHAPPDPSFHLELGRAYMLLSQPRSAVRQFVLSLRLDPKQDRAWFFLANMMGSRGKQRRADSMVILGLSQTPESPLLLGLVKQDAASAAAAPPSAPANGWASIRSFAPAQAPRPVDVNSEEYPIALGKQLTALIERGQAREALKRVREAQARGVRTLGLKLIEGWACEVQLPPDVKGAIRVYEEACEAFPSHWMPRNALGVLLMRQGLRHGPDSTYTKDAIQALEEAVRCAPQEAEPRFNLAQVYFQAGRSAEAATEARRLVDEVKTSDPVIHGHASKLLEVLEHKLNKDKTK